ncbi:unnamed protein product [Eruca vesicaria subsp. sativa]|uniref:Uncharacterized protein n=1 Tax=Eruca vesicaria subsp. sativa TaxID=29727 RepID=A0ABC8JVP2_ERUVS|nr:unnamed protein product [Eruca vesicaria subsp. sativa]
MGFHKLNEIREYAEKLNCEKREWCKARIIPLNGSDNSVAVQMARDMILIASSKPLEIVNFVAIAKQTPKNHELLRVFNCLKTRKFPVIIVEPPAQDNIFVSVEALVDSAQVIGQGKLTIIRPQSSAFDSDSEEEMQKVKQEEKLSRL